jgi:hypothetical protein
MPSTISVIAKSGCIVPRENPAEPVITDNEPVQVVKTIYYQRLLADGSITIHDEKQQKQPQKKGGNK